MFYDTVNYKILILTAFFISFSKSNLSLLLTLLLQTLLLFSLMLSISSFSWASWLLLLVFLGGVLVSFSYVVISTPDQPYSKPTVRSVSVVFLLGLLGLFNLSNTSLASPGLYSYS